MCGNATSLQFGNRFNERRDGSGEGSERCRGSAVAQGGGSTGQHWAHGLGEGVGHGFWLDFNIKNFGHLDEGLGHFTEGAVGVLLRRGRGLIFFLRGRRAAAGTAGGEGVARRCRFRREKARLKKIAKIQAQPRHETTRRAQSTERSKQDGGYAVTQRHARGSSHGSPGWIIQSHTPSEHHARAAYFVMRYALVVGVPSRAALA